LFTVLLTDRTSFASNLGSKVASDFGPQLRLRCSVRNQVWGLSWGLLLKVLKVGAVWVWKPRFPTPPGLGSVPGRVVWTPSGRGVLEGPALIKTMYGLGPPKGRGGGWFGGYAILASQDVLAGRMASGGGPRTLSGRPSGQGLGPPPGRVLATLLPVQSRLLPFYRPSPTKRAKVNYLRLLYARE